MGVRDPITLEVIRNGLLSIVAEMKVLVMRASYSALWREAGDLSCAISNPAGEIVAQGPEDIPVHLASLPFAINGLLERIGVENVEPGDILFQNDPLWGNNHLPDCVMALPIFADNSLLGFSVVRGHWVDIGGSGPGSYSSVTTEALQEGLRIPPVKLCRRGVMDKDLRDIVLANVRGPTDRLGDLMAQYSGCYTGEAGVCRLAAKYGTETIIETFEDILTHSEALTRAEIRKFPNGRYCFEQWSDGDGVTDEPIRIFVNVEVLDDSLVIDFMGSHLQVVGGMNAPLAVTTGATLYAVKCVTDPWNPANSGSYRPVMVSAPKGSVVNPVLPAPVVLGNHETASLVSAAVVGALAQACTEMPERTIAAGSDSATLLAFGGKWRNTDGELDEFICIELQGVAWGARHDKDGINGLRVGVGNTGNQPVEVVETEAPLRVEYAQFVADAGGAGKFRGGCSMERRYRILEDCFMTIVGERSRFPAYGLDGGKEGCLAHFLISAPGRDEWTRLFSKSVPMPLKAGTIVLVQPAAGGGYGDPLDRDPQRVVADVRNQYVTLDKARSDYGVVLHPDTGELDTRRTAELRGLIRGTESR